MKMNRSSIGITSRVGITSRDGMIASRSDPIARTKWRRYGSGFVAGTESLVGPDLVDAALARGRLARPRLNRRKLQWEDRIAPLFRFLGEPIPSSPRVLNLSDLQMAELLETDMLDVEAALYEYANSVTESVFNKRVSFRGLIEFSNVCVKSCGYCGIRKHRQVPRYSMSRDEIVELCLWAFRNGYGSVMLQSGELPTQKRHEFMLETVLDVKKQSLAADLARGTPANVARGLGVAIGLGELSRDMYRELRAAGAHRYLLRIETSNPDLYKRLHPAVNHSWDQRVQCLHNLKEVGFQLGTGVMINLPGQTALDLAKDLRFFREIEADMIGCGPFIKQASTPIGDVWSKSHPSLVEDGPDLERYNSELLELCCRFLSLARITLGDVNISATTALQAINPIGREIALGRGANQLMPILTSTKYRENYQLYKGKPCIDEGHEECRACLSKRVVFADKELHLNDWSDPPSYFRRLRDRNELHPDEVWANSSALP